MPFIFRSIRWSDENQGRWIEPFLGSGVVAFNLAPRFAILTDTNRHIIALYSAIRDGEIVAADVRSYLRTEGTKLENGGADYYYEVRERFNRLGDPLDFLFLNRSCFNGVMRFNRKGAYNVPFGHKPNRFSKAYVTKIANQVSWLRKQMSGMEWELKVASWRDVLADAELGDFVYLDPPYIGRHTDYYNSWDENEARALAAVTRQLPCGFALSMWLENRYRKNNHIEEFWSGFDVRTDNHFYHVGASETLRNSMIEALVIKPGYSTEEIPPGSLSEEVAEQLFLGF